MKKAFWAAVSFGLSVLLFATPAWAVDQTVVGAGNKDAIELSRKAPLVQSTRIILLDTIGKIRDGRLKSATLDAINNTKTCVKHRAGVTDERKTTILQNLKQAGLVDTADDSTFPGGLKAGVFPPLRNDGSKCPRLPQTFFAAPGSGFGSHHSYPGGLAVHEVFNDISDISFASNYRKVYGSSDGLPIVDLANRSPNASDIFINQDLILGAPLWHDWAKPMVFQWNADGTEFAELNFGGNGQTDNYGKPGNSKTGGHHIIGLAEAMKRGLSPEFVITQASAHSAPTLGNEYKVVNWIHTAAILAQIDPVATGYLYRDSQNQLRLPPLRQLGNLNLNALGQTNLLAEYAIHNLSDADFVLSIPAVSTSEVILKTIAPQFGYIPSDAAQYNTQFRNPVLTYLSAERILITYGNKGLDGVIADVRKLRDRKVI